MKGKVLLPGLIFLLILAGTWMYIKMTTSEKDQAGGAEEIILREPYPIDSDKADVNSLPADFNKEQRVVDFLEFVHSNKARKAIGKDNIVTLQAIVKMSQAINAISTETENNTEVEGHLKEFNGKVNELIKNPALADDPSDLKELFTSTSNVLTGLQKENFPSLDQTSKDINNKANELSTDTSVRAQQNEIEDFFVEVAGIIDNMEQPS
jgi:hypothetical protein